MTTLWNLKSVLLREQEQMLGGYIWKQNSYEWKQHSCLEVPLMKYMKLLLAPHPLTLCLKYFLLMLLWQPCPRTTRLLEDSVPVQHMFSRVLGGGMQYVTVLALT